MDLASGPRIYIGDGSNLEPEYAHLIGQWCMVTLSEDEDFATQFRAKFEDGTELYVDADEIRPYTIADDNARQSQHYAQNGR